MRRYLALHFPRWPVQLLRHNQPDANNKPVVLFERSARGVNVRMCSPEANALGVRAGVSLADAKALSTQLLLHELNLAECQAALEELCLWATRFSPLSGVEPAGPHAPFPQTLLLDISGCERVFGGEEKLLKLAVSGFKKRGYKIRAAIAPTLGAAWALTHYGSAETIAPDEPQGLCALLEPLPLASLRLPEEILADLGPLGLQRVADVLRQPRSSLPSRFGAELLQRLDQALDVVPETLVPLRAEPEFRAACSFEYPIRSSETLFQVLEQMTANLARELKNAQRGVLQAECWLHHEIAMPACVQIVLHRSSQSARHLWRLLHTRLEDHFRLPLKSSGAFKRKHKLRDATQSVVIEAQECIEAVALHVTASESVSDQQLPLFERAYDDGSSGELNLLLDRLVTRLGADAVRRVRAADEHLPERGFSLHALADDRMCAKGGTPSLPHYAPKHGRRTARGTHTSAAEPLDAPRPICLFPQPIAAQVSWPSSIVYDKHQHAIRSVHGPERIESGWWREQDQRRDYYVVEMESGARCWVFEELSQHRWFVHGSFD